MRSPASRPSYLLFAAALTLAAPAALRPAPAAADALPEGMRGVGYKLTIANRADFADWVFLIFPTSNHGYAYVWDEAKPTYGVMMQKGWKGPGSSLYAMRKSFYDKWAKDAPKHPHGDNDEEVPVLNAPPSEALKAAANIAPPGLVPDSSPVERIERTFRIKALDDKKFELVLVEEVAVHKDGKRVKKKAK